MQVLEAAILQSGTRSTDDRYVLRELVGRGGMGEVWRALDTAVEREVAIKVPRSHVAGGRGEHWLAAEAQAVARLNHPHLVSLVDRTRLPGGVPGLVFAYVRGKPLTDWCSQPQPWSWVRVVAQQTLEALAYAHGRGVIHRDLKPSNVLLSGSGEEPWINLLDFGIASWQGRDAPAPDEPVPGTRAYMAPEQAVGPTGDLGPWTDLYALGVVLTELLLGELPFPGSTDDEVWDGRIRSRFTPPVQVLAELGVPLRRFLLRLLAPDPAQRFGWAADAIRALPGEDSWDLIRRGRSTEADATDVLTAVLRPEDRDTDPDGDALAALQSMGGSITLEMAPAESSTVALPPSWAVDLPRADHWEDGFQRPARRAPAPAPAASYRLLSMREAPLSGREDEWEFAWDHLSRVGRDHKAVLLLLEGPQGRGKTRFARELAAVAEELGVARSHHVRLRSDGSGAGALRRLLHRVLRIADLPADLREGRVRRVLAEAGYPEDADLVPRLLAMLSPGNAGSGSADEEATTAIELFRVLGRRRPILVWLEDLDRARDRALITWLQKLFDAEDDVPLAVVATARDDAGDIETPEWLLLRASDRCGVIDMERLEDEAIADILRFTAGAAEELGFEVARWCFGDPRAAQQIARHLHETGRLVWSPEGFGLRGDTPSTAGGLKLDSILRVRARDALEQAADPEATRAVVDLLSLVRERAWHGDFLAAARALDLEPARVEAALTPLVMSALVDVRDEGPRLAHTALAESVRHSMELLRRQQLHRAWATVLEDGSIASGRAERLLEAAWNRASCGELAAAAANELEAAHLLRGRREYSAAWRAVQSARERAEADPDLLPPARFADLQVLAAVLEHEAQDQPGTASQLAASLDMLQPLWVTLPPGLERCRADLAHAEALRRAGRPEEAKESLERALEAARSIESAEWECRALTMLADHLRLNGALTQASELADEAMSRGQELEDIELRRAVLTVQLQLAIARSDQRAARLLLDKLRALLRSRATWQDLQNLWVFRGEVERLSGSESNARQAYETALALGRKRGLANAAVLLRLAVMHLERGSLDPAEEALGEAGSLEAVIGPYSHELRASRAVLQAELRLRRGDLTAAAAALQDAEILQSQSPIALPQLQASLRRAEAFAREPALRKRLNELGRDMLRRLG